MVSPWVILRIANFASVLKYRVCTREPDIGAGDTRQRKNNNLTYKTTTVELNKS